MSLPGSPLFRIEDIPDAGRGVVALRRLGPSTPVHVCGSPVAHVIFRQYRREVCAHCFFYDRGRTLSERDGDTGKVFCGPACRAQWLDDEGELGLAAWKALHAFVQKHAKALVPTTMDRPSENDARPAAQQVANAWWEVSKRLEPWMQAHPPRPRKSPLFLLQQQQQRPTTAIDPDIMSFFLSAVLSQHRRPEQWQDQVLSLAVDDTPYSSPEDLGSHLDSCIRLLTLLTPSLASPAAVAACRDIVGAASHNAFGIRAGGEDAEEYMGYGVYPSASYFNHSCAPNLVKRRVGRSWEFATDGDVEEGEQLCITYLGGDEKDMTVDQRRDRLAQHWGFVCQCRRCLDDEAASA